MHQRPVLLCWKTKHFHCWIHFEQHQVFFGGVKDKDIFVFLESNVNTRNVIPKESFAHILYVTSQNFKLNLFQLLLTHYIHTLLY